MENSTNRYIIRAKVRVVKLSYLDKQSAGKKSNETADVVLLVPEINTQASEFLTERLPEMDEENTEVAMLMGGPVFGFVRGALQRGSRLCDRPHIFVMSKRAENTLKAMHGREFEVTILSQEEEADYDESSGAGMTLEEMRSVSEKSERGLYE
jgi:hypothetical protein